MLGEHAARPARASRRTSRGRYASSARTRPRSSRARFCSSTAAWGCRWRGTATDTQGRDHRHRGRDAARQRHRDDVAEPVAGGSGAGPITQFDSTEYSVTLRVRGERLRPARLDRPQAGAPHGPLRAARSSPPRARRRPTPASTSPPERSESAPRSPPGSAACKSFQDCYDTLKERGPDRVNPFAIPAIIPNMGAGWVSMELGTRGPLSSQCTACAASNMAIGDGARRDPARARRRDVLRRHGGRDQPGRHRRLRCDARALAPQRRSRAGEPARSTPAATASSWARPARSSCSRSSSARRRAARRSTPSCSATACRRTRRTSRNRIRRARTRRAR